jgi:hypothetical protein
MGIFCYLGEIHEGKHTGIISKRLFDKVQTVLERRGKPTRKANEPKPLCGSVYCSCGMMFTAMNSRLNDRKTAMCTRTTYYRCTRKSKTVVVVSHIFAPKN